MTDSLKDRLKTDLQSIKAEGTTRTTRIRNIIQTAATQSLTELREGMGEIRTTANQSFSTAAQTFSESETSETPSFSTLLNGIRVRIANQMRVQITNLNTKLTIQYGDRYESFKQRLSAFRNWYNNSKANAEAIGVDPVQQKQAEIELKIADQGAFVARKEQQIRQQVKQFVDAALTKR